MMELACLFCDLGVDAAEINSWLYKVDICTVKPEPQLSIQSCCKIMTYDYFAIASYQLFQNIAWAGQTMLNMELVWIDKT